MINALRAEFRKVFTLRSTYVIFFLIFALLTLLGFYVEGFVNSASAADPQKFNLMLVDKVPAISVFIAIIGILLVTHEYRYNTIMHTLTLSRSRLKVLIAKTLLVTAISVVATLLAVGLIFLLTRIGLAIKGVTLVPQTIYFADILWRIVFYAWGFSMIGMIVATIVRNQVGSIMVFFVFPSTIEPLSSLLLKQNAQYMPFNLLAAVISNVGQVGASVITAPVTHGKAALLITLYLIIAWVIAAALFVRRDAN